LMEKRKKKKETFESDQLRCRACDWE